MAAADEPPTPKKEKKSPGEHPQEEKEEQEEGGGVTSPKVRSPVAVELPTWPQLQTDDPFFQRVNVVGTANTGVSSETVFWVEDECED